MPTDHPRIMKAQETFKVWSELEKELIELQKSLNKGDSPAIYEQLKHLVTGFTPDADIVDWIAASRKNSFR